MKEKKVTQAVIAAEMRRLAEERLRASEIRIHRGVVKLKSGLLLIHDLGRLLSHEENAFGVIPNQSFFLSIVVMEQRMKENNVWR